MFPVGCLCSHEVNASKVILRQVKWLVSNNLKKNIAVLAYKCCISNIRLCREGFINISFLFFFTCWEFLGPPPTPHQILVFCLPIPSSWHRLVLITYQVQFCYLHQNFPSLLYDWEIAYNNSACTHYWNLNFIRV